METCDIRAKLVESRASIGNLQSPPGPGVYCLYTKDRNEPSLRSFPDDGILYVGRARDLGVRLHETHFRTGQSGRSSVRRSLGAILKEQLSLKAMPRNGRMTEHNCHHYQFVGNGDITLTDWMKTHLEVGVCPLSAGWKEAEAELIYELQPPLCLKEWRNPLRSLIMALRKVCADEARSWRAQDG